MSDSNTIKFDELEEQEAAPAPAKKAALVDKPAGPSTELATDLAEAGLGGEWGTDDIDYPKLKILGTQATLVVEEGMPAGSINLMGEHTLVEKDKPVRVCVLLADKLWQEDVDFDSGDIGKVFSTLAEARAEGFTPEYGAANRVRPMCRLLLLIEKPDGFDDTSGVFAYEYEGKHYTLAGATFAKTAFNTTGKAIYSYAQLSGNPTHATWWKLSSTLKKFGENKWYGPKMQRSEELNEGELAFVEEVSS